jgi:hypothetical protein
MSTRLSLSGFSLDTMRSWFGSGDQAIISDLEAELDRAVKHENDPEGLFNPGFCEEFRTALRQVVEGGVPVPGLKIEGVHHVFLADWLAHYQQEHVLTDCDYKYFPLLDLIDMSAELMTPAGRKLFGYLVEGRPLFGEGFGQDLPYGYLTFEESGQLRSCLESMARSGLDDPDIEEFVTDFCQFLDEIRSEKRDVWATVG